SQKSEDIRLLEQTLVCKVCWTNFYHKLNQDNPQSIEYFTNSEGKGTFLKCRLCKEECIRSRKYKLDTISKDF
ncbi:13834_t:CDS:1, partial [Dentiscutata heterogama]